MKIQVFTSILLRIKYIFVNLNIILRLQIFFLFVIEFRDFMKLRYYFIFKLISDTLSLIIMKKRLFV